MCDPTPEQARLLYLRCRVMREAQKRYFATRDNQALKDSKAAECQVDRLLREISSGERQERLFT